MTEPIRMMVASLVGLAEWNPKYRCQRLEVGWAWAHGPLGPGLWLGAASPPVALKCPEGYWLTHDVSRDPPDLCVPGILPVGP
jgi:hypothetical protein